MKKEFFAGKKVLVMGLGHFGGGVDVAEFAANAGAKVVITDLASAEQLSDSIKKLQKFPDIEFHLGSHEPADFQQADIIAANPAVAADNEFLKLARRHNKFITSQISIFFELCPAPIIGITGANGKSTTAALTTHLLRNRLSKSMVRDTSIEHRASSIEKLWLSGNIGNEPLLTVIGQISSNDLVVLELSSFQLEQLAQIQKAPKVALLTNLTPNHLDRYGTFADYCAAKKNIFKFQKLDRNCPAVSIFNAEDKIGAEWFEKYKKESGRICIKFSSDDVSNKIRDQFGLAGRANLSNLAAALCLARHFGADDDRIKSALPEFKPLPHRLELVAKINGVCWYNDSKATTPQGAIAALEAFDPAPPRGGVDQPAPPLKQGSGPTIIIAGGYDKNLAFDELGEKIARNAKAAILLGQTAQKIADAINNSKFKIQNSKLNHATQVQFSDSLQQAVELANNLAQAGDVVLLSPACASYDMFDNFQHRGQEFCKLVRRVSG